MISAGQLLGFTAASLVMIVIPGPGVLFVIGRALAHGRRTALATACGHAAGNYVVAAFVAVGLGAILQRSAAAFVVVKVIGAAYLEKNLAALKPDGRLAVIGLQGGRRAELDLGLLLGKRVTVAGTTLRARPVDQKSAIISRVRQEVWPMIESGRIRPVVDMRIPVQDAAKAHERMAASGHIGKIVLTVSPS